jgi:hypothetical protein
MIAKIVTLGSVLALIAGADILRGCQETLPKGDPQRLVSNGRAGLRAEPRVALDQNNKAHFLQHMVSGFDWDHNAQPKAVSYVADVPNCVFPAPAEGAKVVYLTASRGDMDSRIHTFGASDIRQTALQYVEDWRKAGREQPVSFSSRQMTMAIMNVVVTDTSQPLHLVLGLPQSVVNFQIAPGVTIAGVSLIAERESAVANLPDSVPLHVMRPATVERCEATPWLRPTQAWQLSRLAKESPGSHREALENRSRLFTRFDTFFRRSFGQGSEINMIGGEYISGFLIGRPPTSLDQRLPYRSLAVAQLRMARPENLVVGTRDDLRKALGAKMRPVAEQMASGSLAALNRN